MRHFNYLSKQNEKENFYLLPEAIDKKTDRSILSHALGATLYMPGTRISIAEDIISGKYPGLASTILCLEDSIGEAEVAFAEENLVQLVKQLKMAIDNKTLLPEKLPLIFIRVRNPEQMLRMIECIGEDAQVLTGFVFPKFMADSRGYKYFKILKKYSNSSIGPLFGMPILENHEVIYCESRLEKMLEIKTLLSDYRELVLNIRMGATDFSGLFGLRRGPDVTIYDIIAIRDCIADIVNIFGRIESDYVVSGSVWEYFSNAERILKPQLRKSPFEEHYGAAGIKIRSQLLNKYIDGLVREVILDKENGIIGKTIIHPSHIIPVQSLYVVTHEEYLDALDILENSENQLGVIKSLYTNKMNEVKPHYNWAKKILLRAKVYGVFNEKHNFTSLLTEEVHV
ncbi:MAG: HpcH/HpaI aldolase/citrate lyase family protein [Desulfitobacteriaceae bacterium]